MVDRLLLAFADIHVPVTAEQAHTMARYYELVRVANETMNLTSIQSEQEAAIVHFADSISPLRFALLNFGAMCCDMGSGAGFPGMVLAIARPDCKFVLVDSLSKRVRFLSDAAKELALHNVSVLHARAEDAGQNTEHRERYDVVVSRAVAPFPVLCEYCLPLVKVRGHMIAYKGPGAPEELACAKNAMQILGASRAEILDSGIPGRSHRLIVVQKAFQTPLQYPRKAGTPARQPL